MAFPDTQMTDFLGPFYELAGIQMGSREAVNVFLQSGEGLAKYAQIARGTQGTAKLQSIIGPTSTSPCRGLYLSSNGANGSSLYWVFGTKLGRTWKDSTGAYQQKVIVDIGLANPRVSMTDNGGKLCLVDGLKMWIVDLYTDVATDITSTLPFQYPKSVVYLKSRFYAISGDSSTTTQGLAQVVKSNLIWWSELGIQNSAIWGAANFVACEVSADAVTQIAIRQGDLWAMGEQTYQVFGTTDNPDLPIAYAGGSASSIGCKAQYSVVSFGDTIFFVGSNAQGKGIVYQGQGYNVERVSNHGIEQKISEAGIYIDSAIAFAFQDQGHTFYALTIPSGADYDGITLVYDTATRTWHTRASRDPQMGTLKPWNPLFCSYAFGKTIVGSLDGPVLMDLSFDYNTEYYLPMDAQIPIYRMIQGPVMHQDLKLVQYIDAQLDMVVGNAQQTGWSRNPVGILQWSDDGGRTFSSALPCNIPLRGEYSGRVRWIGLGSARARVFRFTMTEDLPFMAGGLRCSVEVSQGW